ncbi:CBS domain-containing protein [Mesotoga sp. UBA6090]|uniref:CBS domain-containing protein n=1 Tax=Mesotoga sp. UBA6090 TaxID=1946860 RepID=UPI0025FC8DD0|nr:CBS domain-containing protein [Mesotoga sp. UBA6090]
MTIDLNDTLDKALKIIGEKSFSQIPVYEGRQFRGILTAYEIARWMAFVGEEERAYIKEMPIRDVMDYAEEDKAVKFVSRKATLFEIAASFGVFSALGKRLEAILVTENGRRSETPLQIITIWDLPTISAALQE